MLPELGNTSVWLKVSATPTNKSGKPTEPFGKVINGVTSRSASVIGLGGRPGSTYPRVYGMPILPVSHSFIHPGARAHLHRLSIRDLA